MTPPQGPSVIGGRFYFKLDRQFKSLPFINLKREAKGRSRVGIASVFGNIDAAGERVMPGAFAKTISEGATRARHLWNHSWQHPPTASIEELREVSREELPEEVLEKAPSATGGLLVRRKYYDTELSNWILQAIDAGDVNEMSFAYDVIASEIVEEPIPGDSEGKTYSVRNLTELKVFDTSDVLWGCNAATVAAGAKGTIDVPPIGVIVQYVLAHREEVKAGRRNSAADQALIDMMHEAAVGLGCSNCKPPDNTDDEKAEPAVISSSLAAQRLKLQDLRIGTLTI